MSDGQLAPPAPLGLPAPVAPVAPVPQAAPVPPPDYELHRGLACAATSLVIGLTQGFGMNLVGSNLASIQGSLGATAAEATWLTTAYFAPAMSATLLVTKFRLHFGMRAFTSLGLLFFLLIGALHLAASSLASAIAARAALGLVAPALNTMAVLYMVQAFPKRLIVVGGVLGFATLQLGTPLSRVISTELLEFGQWHGLLLVDVALALLSLAAIHAVKLAPQPKQPAFSWGDLIAIPLYSGGLALLCVVVTMGRLYWWTDAPWLGVLLACSIGCLGLYAVVDLNRKQPLIDLRWVASPYMLRFIAAVVLFRIVLSEQTVGVVGLMTVLGQSNEQMRTLFSLATLGILFGFFIAIVLALRKGTPWLGAMAALLVMVAAWMDGNTTSLTRPAELYLTQTMIAAGLGTFFAAAVLLGLLPAVKEGRNLVSFVAMFSLAQYLGSVLGTAWIQSLVHMRQQWHYAALVQHLTLADPQVATRIAQLAGSVARVVGDHEGRASQALTLLAQQVTRESFVLAYNDVFKAVAFVSAGMLVWLILIGWRRARQQAATSN